MGRLYLRGSCAPADCACPDAAGAEGSAALPKLAPLSALYRTIRDARPWSPTQLTTHPFHYRTLRIPPVPQRASQGLARGKDASRPQRASRLRGIPLLSCVSMPSLAPIGDAFHFTECLSVKGWLLSPSNKLEAQPESRCDPL